MLDGRERSDHLRGAQPRALLAFLVLERRRSVGRGELVAALWGESPPPAADEALRSLLSNVRRAIDGERLIGRDALRLRLPSSTWIDVEAAAEAIHDAESAVALGEWQRGWIAAHIAISITERPLLPQLTSAWLDDHRERLAELRLRALETLAASGLALAGPEIATARRAARSLIEARPLRESGYELLMQALAAEGNPAEGLLVFDKLRVVLRDELGATPTDAARRIHSELLGRA